jgi:hypothetical protein
MKIHSLSEDLWHAGFMMRLSMGYKIRDGLEERVWTLADHNLRDFLTLPLLFALQVDMASDLSSLFDPMGSFLQDRQR